MLFCVDAHTIGCHLTGNEVYIRNLLEQYSQLDPASNFIAYVSKPNAAALVPDRFRKRRVSENPFVRLGFDIPLNLRRDRPDLIHVQYTGPLFRSTPMVVSVHDISYLHYPEYFTYFRSRQLRLTVRRTVRAAARILTPSEFSKRSIIEAYQIPEDKVAVVHNAVSNEFRPMHRATAQAWVRRKYDIKGPFILTVGDIQPRKNHLGLIRAFEELALGAPSLTHDLVLVGKDTWFAPAVRKAVAKSAVANRIRFTDWVSDDDLRYFYGACDCFAFPSFYEGFGLPILEAMACGRAVVCSNTSAMPEVANAAALLFDPNCPSEIARALRDVLLDHQLRLRMERLGVQRASGFTWSRAAQKTLEVYHEVAEAARSVAAVSPAKSVTALPR